MESFERRHASFVAQVESRWSVVRVRVPARGFAVHTHDEYVISVNSTAVIRERVRLGRRRFDVEAAQVTAYNPGEVQSSVAETHDDQPWECLTLYVAVDRMRGLNDSRHVEITRPVITDPRIASAIRTSAATRDPQLASEWAHWALTTCIDAAGRPATAPGAMSQRHSSELARRAMSRMREDLSAPISLEQLAAHVGIGVDLLAREFVKATGVPPYAWHLHARLLEAQHRLRRGIRPIEVAHALGFSDQAHLNRHYKAAYGVTPGREFVRNRSRPPAA